MIILVIYQNGILAPESEGQTPIAAHLNGPMTPEMAVQWVQPPARSVHIFRSPRVVEGKKLLPQSRGMLRLDACLRAALKELLDTFMAKALDHRV